MLFLSTLCIAAEDNLAMFPKDSARSVFGEELTVNVARFEDDTPNADSKILPAPANDLSNNLIKEFESEFNILLQVSREEFIRANVLGRSNEKYDLNHKKDKNIF